MNRTVLLISFTAMECSSIVEVGSDETRQSVATTAQQGSRVAFHSRPAGFNHHNITLHRTSAASGVERTAVTSLCLPYLLAHLQVISLYGHYNRGFIYYT